MKVKTKTKTKTKGKAAEQKPKSETSRNEMPAALRAKAGKDAVLSGASVLSLGPIAENSLVKMIIETPRGSRNKYDYDEDSGLFQLKSVLPAGMSFPFDFGFIPQTKAQDGDPLDVMILMDEPGCPGVLVQTRIVGVLQANQTGRTGKTARNDRVIGVHVKSMLFSYVHTVDDLPKELLKQLEYFFIAYNAGRGKKFAPLGWFGPDQAYKAIEETMIAYNQAHSKRK